MKTNFLYQILSLFYPEVCPACGVLLQKKEKTVCMSCCFLMPKTGYEFFENNPVARVFWGRLPINAASACYFFAKQGRVQHIIHELKYSGNREAGYFLGREMAIELHKSNLYQGIDFIVPVPLHPKRMRFRGYNQSEVIAIGMADILKVPISTTHLVRTVSTATQTKKSREARWQNVKDIFELHKTDELCNKHVLLVDDVITSGSTIEVCANVLFQAPHIKVSIAAAAFAQG